MFFFISLLTLLSHLSEIKFLCLKRCTFIFMPWKKRPIYDVKKPKSYNSVNCLWDQDNSKLFDKFWWIWNKLSLATTD